MPSLSCDPLLNSYCPLVKPKLLFFHFKYFNSNKNMITIYHMQIQNNMEVCCVKVSYTKGLTTILKKNVQIWKKDNNFYGIFKWFWIDPIIWVFMFFSILHTCGIKAKDLFPFASVLEIGSHAAQGVLFPNESKGAECVANITRRRGKFWVLGQLGIHNWTVCLKK